MSVAEGSAHDVPTLPWEEEAPLSHSEQIEAIAEVLDEEDVTFGTAEDEDNSDDGAEEEEDELADESDENADDEDQTDEPVYKVKVDGEEQEVPLSELISGYSRTSVFTKRMQEVARDREAVNSELNAVRAYREEVVRKATALAQIEAALPPEIGQAIRIALQQTQQQISADISAEYARQVEEGRQLLPEYIPEWKDKQVASKDKAAMVDYALSLGYSEEDIARVTDPRVIVLLRNAMLYETSRSRAHNLRQKIKRRPVLKPGSRAPQIRQGSKAAKSRSLRRATERLQQSGSERDAAEVFALMLGDELS